MEVEQFLKAYANTPLGMRSNKLLDLDGEEVTLSELYVKIHKLNDQIRKRVLEQGQYIALASGLYCHETRSFSRTKPVYKWRPPRR